MNEIQVKKALEQLRKTSKKRNFNQSIDFIANLKDINTKKAEDNVDVFVPLKNPSPKNFRICALVGKELIEKAKVFDKVISEDEFINYKDKTNIKKLSK